MALHNTFLLLKDFVRLYYKDFDNHDDYLITMFVSLVMSYMFIRMYIVLHDIDEKFNDDPLTGTTNSFFKAIERFFRIVLFFLVLFCLKPFHFEFLDNFWGRWYFWIQPYGEWFSSFMAGLIYDQKETEGLIARTGSDMWVNFDKAYPPNFGAILMLIASLFFLWDAVSLIFRDFSTLKMQEFTRTKDWPVDENDRNTRTHANAWGPPDYVSYAAERYLSRIHGLRNVYRAPHIWALRHALRSKVWKIAPVVIQCMAYFTSLKFLERVCLFAFGLVLTASFKVQPHISLTLLALFGLSSIALSAYQYRIGGQLIDAALKPFVFVFGKEFGAIVGLVSFLILIGNALAPFPARQRDYWIYFGMLIGPAAIFWAVPRLTKFSFSLLKGIKGNRANIRMMNSSVSPEAAGGH